MPVLTLVMSPPPARHGTLPRARRRPAALADLFAQVAAASAEPTAAPAQAAAPLQWVAQGTLATGTHPAADGIVAARVRLEALAGSGVRHLIDLSTSDEVSPYHALLPALSRTLTRPVTCERHALPEGEVPPVAAINAVLGRIDALMAIDALPYVHCREGRDRSATVLACWMVRHGHAPQDALRRMTAATRDGAGGRHAVMTLAQRRCVLDWAWHDNVLLRAAVAA